jgi:dipeptidyl aminopeptidase/acylaminoacyl peptidase
VPKQRPIECALLAVLVATSARPSTQARGERTRGVTVADTIQMTTVPETKYAAEDSSKSRIALFRPDGKKFVMVVERGVLATNEREFSLFLFETAALFHRPKPKMLVSMRSRSNRDAIRNIQWIDDSHLIFLGEAGESSQVYVLSVASHRLERLTEHRTAVVDFAFNAKRQEIVYAAETTPLSAAAAYQRCARGFAVTNQALDDIPRSLTECREPSLLDGLEVYAKTRGQAAVRIPFVDYYETLKPISIGPTGEYAIFAVLVRHVPRTWQSYEDPFVRAEALGFRNRGPFSWLMEYILVDLVRRRTHPILDSPMDLSQGASVWSPDGKSVAISGAFLPLDVTDPAELTLRRAHAFVVEVDLATGRFRKISDKQLIAARWDTDTDELFLRAPNRNPERGSAIYRKQGNVWVEETARAESKDKPRPTITLEQDLNTPPKIFVSDATHPEKQLLLDLNPQFARLAFGKVKAISWNATDGHEVEGGLYYPPDYQPGRRYPLVIQTHGFAKDEFWINGPWNSAFAAQPMAARDIVVLQVGHATEKGSDGKAAGTPREAPRQMGVYEGAIDYLDDQGVIDRTRVGIIGFSRTVYSVEYTLTHSAYDFAAATVADGFDGGYLQYLVNPYAKREWMTVNGGDPFGATFELWRENSPSFTVERLRTPVRMEGYGGIAAVLGNWEWYAKLVFLDRPVDLIYLPDGTHLLVKPWERLASQEGNVDWFCFWLKGEVDANPQKAEQYQRWEQMRVQQNQVVVRHY